MKSDSKKSEKKERLVVVLPLSILARLDKVAKSNFRTRANLAGRYIQKGLEHEEWTRKKKTSKNSEWVEALVQVPKRENHSKDWLRNVYASVQMDELEIAKKEAKKHAGK